MSATSWAIVTGEYPPPAGGVAGGGMAGGVADYTQALARALVAAGDDVRVIVGAAELVRTIDQVPQSARVLVQYTPQAFGCGGMNIAFAAFVRALGRARAVDVMFHEVHCPIDPSQPLRHNLLGGVTKWMAKQLARAAQRVFVSTSAWEPLVRSMVSPNVLICVTPVPSNLPTSVSPDCVANVRRRYASGMSRFVVGHFGTFGRWQRAMLGDVLPALLAETDAIAMLIGRGGEDLAADLARRHPCTAGRIVATGGLRPDAAAAHIASCDLLVQPFIDGITTRRSSAMAGLALGVPIVSNDGALTESIWRDTRAVELAPAGDAAAIVSWAKRLLHDADRRRCLSHRAAGVYRERFDVSHTVRALREPFIT